MSKETHPAEWYHQKKVPRWHGLEHASNHVPIEQICEASSWDARKTEPVVGPCIRRDHYSFPCYPHPQAYVALLALSHENRIEPTNPAERLCLTPQQSSHGSECWVALRACALR